MTISIDLVSATIRISRVPSALTSGIAHDPLVERFCLADVKRFTGMIKHAVNPGLAAQLFGCLTDHPEATFEIRAGLGGIRRRRLWWFFIISSSYL